MKSIKKIAMLVAVLLVVLSLGVLMVSCGDDTPESSTQGSTNDSTQGSTNNSAPTESSKPSDGTDNEDPNLVKVTVLDQNGKGIKGAAVQICQGETCFAKPIVTGKDGTGSRVYDNLGTEQLKAKILEIDGNEDFIASTEYVYFNSDSKELTIKVRKVVVNVFDQDDKAVEAAVVQLYQGEGALDDVIVTDADGIAYAFVMANGGELGAKVTEVLSGGSYELDKEVTYFGTGIYEGNVIVSKNQTYSVKISTMMGDNVVGAKVELYDVLKNRKQKTAYTDASGIAKFDDVDPGEYYVKVFIESPAYTIITESTDGKYMFGSSTSLSIDVVELSYITYTLNAPADMGECSISIYDKYFQFVDAYPTFEDGVATFEAENGDYVVIITSYEDGVYYEPIFFTKYDSAVGEVVKKSGVAGSSSEFPIYITDGTYFYNEPGKTVWYAVPFAQGKDVVFNCYGESYTVNFEGMDPVTVDADNGATINISGDSKVALFTITSAAEGAAEGAASAVAPGSVNAPLDVKDSLEGDKIVVDITLEPTYYSYTATEDGILTIVFPNESYEVLFRGYDANVSFMDDGKVIVMIPLAAEETVVFSFAAYDEEYNATEAQDVEFTFTFGEKKVDYTAYVYADFDAAEGVVVILYRYDYEIWEFVEVARATTDAEGACTFTDIVYANGYILRVEAPKDYELLEDVSYGTFTEAYVYLTHERDGSSDYPFQVDTETGAGSVSIPAEGTVWYEVYVVPSYDGTVWELIFDSDEVEFKVYYADTNDDGVIDENDTPYGTSTTAGGITRFTFYDNNKNFKIAITSTAAEAIEFGYGYAPKEAPAGATVDNAKEFEESAGDVDAIEAGQTIYFRYVGESCKLTVTLISENVTLKTITFDMMGDYELTAADGNTFVVESTMGEWIYFAITAEADTTYELVITAE